MKTKTIFGMFAVMTLLLAAFAVAPVAAGKADPQFTVNLAKDPQWNPTTGGSGKLMYKNAPNAMFVFNGKNLVAGQEYALISYSEPWGTMSNVLGTGTADGLGNVQIKGGAINYVCNPYPTPTSDEYSGTGAKIWLVPTTDFNVATGFFIGWNPGNYLFESDLIYKGCGLPSVNLVQKDIVTWVPKENGITGQLVYKSDKTAFVFKGVGLPAGEYKLISYNEATQGGSNGILGTGTAGGNGKIQITGIVMDLKYYAYSTGEYQGQNGAKIWLVPSSSLNGDNLNWLAFSSYLFEISLIPA